MKLLSKMPILVLTILLFFLQIYPILGAEKVETNWGWSTLEEYEKSTGRKITRFFEAPMLAKLVREKKLPPVKERLPLEPLVDKPFERVGRYGGTLRLGMVSPTTWYPAALHTVEYMLNLDRTGSKVVPNIAKGWKFEDDGKTFYLYLRKGMKWSDGAPFTADDIMFYWNAVVLNDEVMPVKPIKFRPGGKLMIVEKVDDYTIRFKFSVPYYNFIYYLAGVVFSGAQNDIYLPAHALKKYHIAYNKDADKLAKEQKYEHWWQLFNKKRTHTFIIQDNVDIPVLAPWVPKQVLPEGVIWERNPYYYKIDTAGNQLPYIDRVVATPFHDIENLIAKMVAGEYDYQDWSTAISDYPVLMEGAKKGNYKVWLAPSLWTSNAAFTICQNYTDDPVVADILRNLKFRQALSVAINRDEINQVYALGKGVPFQATVHPNCYFYEEKWGKYFIQYDPKLANRLLDEIGMDKRDKDGFRLRPDGKPFTLIITQAPDAAPIKVSEMVASYWEAVGIRTMIKPVDRGYMTTLFDSGKYMVTSWAMDGASELPVVLGLCGYLQGWQWANQWQLWVNSKGEKGIKPPEEVQRMITLYQQVPILYGKEQEKALKEVVEIFTTGLYRIGTVGMVPKPAITHINLGNVNTKTYTDNADVGCGTFNRLYQLYWKK